MKRRPRLMDRLVAWSPVLLLGSLAALTYWLDAQVAQQQPRRDGSARHDPDLFIDRFRAVSFDADGRVRQSLAADHAQHYPDDESTDLSALSLVLTEPGNPQFSVTANKGVVSGDRETIELSGNVRALREASRPAPGGAKNAEGPSGPVRLTTEYLKVTPKASRAETDKAVTIEEPRGIIRTVGMILDNKGKTLKLKSDVRGTLQPQTLPK
jgi:lipopolysaccharide export system protein LptC